MCVLTLSLEVSKDQCNEVIVNFLRKMHFPYPHDPYRSHVPYRRLFLLEVVRVDFIINKCFWFSCI